MKANLRGVLEGGVSLTRCGTIAFRRSLAALACLSLVLAISLGPQVGRGVGAAPCSVSGLISTDTVWGPSACDPYIVTGSVAVVGGVTLTVQPGTTVKFESLKALSVQGMLVARGTEGSPITFTSKMAAPAKGDWGYIHFADSSIDATFDGSGSYTGGSIIQYSAIEYAGGASVSENGALRIEASSPFIDHNTIRNNKADGIHGWNGAPRITSNTVTDNGIGGSAAAAGILVPANTIVVGNTVYNNNGPGISIYSEDNGPVTVTHNTVYGNNGPGIIGGRDATITNNTVFSNSGIGILAGHNSTISNNRVSANRNSQTDWRSCRHGGGIGVSGGSTAVTSNVVSGNYGETGGGICVEVNSGSVRRNIVVGNRASGGGGIHSSRYSSSGGALSLEFNAILRNSAGNSAAAIASGDALFRNNTILDNVATGSENLRAVYITANPTFDSNNIERNTGYALYNSNAQGSANVNATSNWWGATNDAAVQGLIYDWFDDSNLGMVDYSPYRTSHNTSAPISPPTGLAAAISGASIVLNWSPNPESDLAGYKVFWDTDSSYPYANSVNVGNVTNYALAGLGSSARYYVAITAFDSSADGPDDQTDGNESWFSGEVTVDFATPTPTPTNTPTPSPTPTVTPIPTPTPTRTPTPTPGPTPTSTPVLRPAPIVLRVEPTSGPNTATASIAIYGANFWGVPTAWLGSVPLQNPGLANSSRIDATVPSGLGPGAYDIIVGNPDGRSGTGVNLFTVTGTGRPILEGVYPRGGISSIPNDIAILGYNFQEGITATLTSSALGAAVPLTVTRAATARLGATVPAGLAAGVYDLVAANPGVAEPATLSNAYTVMASGGDDLYVDGSDIWTDPVVVRKGSSVRLGVNVHRRGGKNTLAQVPVSFYEGDPNAGGRLIGSRSILAFSPRSSDTAWVDWSVGDLERNASVYAVVDPSATISETTRINNTANRNVSVLPAPLDSTAPSLTGMLCNGGLAATTSPAVTILLAAEDNSGGSGLGQMLYAEREFSASAGQWIRSQDIGWITYTAPYYMTLTDRGGVRYVQAWVSDNAGNISPNIIKCRIDYIPASDSLQEGQVRLYRRTLRVGDGLTANLETLTGDADLYVWSPTGQRWVSNNSGTAADSVTLTATEAGVYQIEVYGYLASTFRLSIAGGAAQAGMAEAGERINTEKTARTAPVVSASSEPEGTAALPPPDMGNTVWRNTSAYLPVLARGFSGGW